MRIDRIRVEGFGALSQVSYTLAPGLNLLEGANEAGKSTLLAFIRAVLFGFARKGSAQRYEVPEGAAFGGELWLSGAGERLLVRRARGRRSEGQLSLRNGDGAPQPPERLDALLHGVSQRLFEEVFAFGLSELASFEGLAREGSVADALFAAGFDGARRLPKVKQALESASESVFKGGAAKQPLNLALQALGQLRAERQALGDLPARYQQLVDRQRALEDGLTSVRHALAEREQAHQALLGLHHAAADLVAWERLAAAIAAFDPELAHHPPDAVTRFELERGRRDEVEGRLAQAQVLLSAAERSRERIVGSLLEAEQVTTLRAAMARLLGWKESWRTLGDRRSAAMAERRALHAEVARLDDALVSRLETLDVGAAARAAWAACSAELNDASRLRADAAAERAQRCDRRDDLVERQRRASEELAGLCAVPVAALEQRRREAQRLRDLGREDAALNEARAALRRELEILGRDPESAPSTPAHPIALAVPAMVALLLAVGALLLGDHRIAWVCGILAGSMLIAAGIHRRRTQVVFARARAAFESRRSAQQVQTQAVAQRLRELDHRQETSEAERLRLREALGVRDSEAAPEVLLEGVEQSLRQAHRREALARELDALADPLVRAKRDVEAAEARVQAATDRRMAAEHEAATFLTARGLSPRLRADAVTALLAELARLQQSLRAVSHRMAVLEQESESVETARAELQAACAQAGAGCADTGTDAEALVVQAQAMLQGHDQAEEAVRAEATRIEGLESQIAGDDAIRAAADEALRTLFDSVGVKDEAQLRTRSARAAERARIAQQLELHRIGIERAVRCATEVAYARWKDAGGGDGVAQRLAELEAELNSMKTKATALAEEKGAVASERERLGADARVAEIRLEEEQLGARAQALARTYARDRLGLILLARARRRYEEAQQPALLRAAAALFAALTGGRYRNVLVSAEADADLQVVDAAGRVVSAERLSRGTREQLYLAFRMAVLEDFAARKGPLPIVLDDVWVNFDPQRARSAIAVLAQRSRAQQVIAFTCHPWVRELFVSQGAQVVAADHAGDLIRSSA